MGLLPPASLESPSERGSSLPERDWSEAGGNSPISDWIQKNLFFDFILLPGGSDWIQKNVFFDFIPLPGGSDFIRGTGVPHFVPLAFKASDFVLFGTRYRTWTDNPEGADFESAVFTNFTKRVCSLSDLNR